MKKILIIEDDYDISEIIVMALTGRYLIEARTDNCEIRELLERFPADLIMIDYYVGQKNAVEIIEEIRIVEKYKNLPIILFTGHPDIKKLAFDMGAKAYLAKPFNLKDLYSRIEEVLSQQL